MGRRSAPLLLSMAFFLAGCAAASPSPSVGPSAALPSHSANWSFEPEPATEILFRLASWSDVTPLFPEVTLYADGRLLTYDTFYGGTYQRTLNQRGMDALLSEVVGSGWFEQSHSVPLELLPGVELPALGPGGDTLILRTEPGALIEVTNAFPGDGTPYWVRSAERVALTAIAARMRTLDWLPDDGWLAPDLVRYQASAFLVISGFFDASTDRPCLPGEPTDFCARDVDTLEWPIAPPPAGFGAAFVSADGQQIAPWDHCLVIGRALAEAFARAFGDQAMVNDTLGSGAQVPWRDRGGWYDVWLRPLLPEEPASCAGKNSPGVGFH